MQKGFTLIETLVAVLILSVAIAGPLTIASKGLVTALVAKDQITAYYLAQDAIEFTRFARDTNTLQGGNWLTGVGAASPINLTTCTNAGGAVACTIDSRTNVVTSCPAAICPVIKFNSAAGTNYFSYTSGTATIYRRSVKITNPLVGRVDEAKVAVTVSWSDTAGVTRQIVVNENIFNWQ